MSKRPNVLIIIMDDLTWGDIRCHGNPHVRTPNLDRLHQQSTRLTRYYSGPLCTPARAALMTGRYPYRTRALDTYCGRSMMDPGEVTLAEVLRAAGYRTGLFGKWHLGDCYPMRPEDKGFEETLWHAGGGLRQPGNPTLNDGYFDPDLRRNGKLENVKGYCTDIFADATIAFIEKHQHEPFFAYLATNAPHHPFEVDEKLVEPYRKLGLNETDARVYAMVENIDVNVGKVMAKLDQLHLADDTIVIYTSDHGWCQSTLVNGRHRFNGGLRDGKGTMYDGGLKVPCFWRWPGHFRPAADIDRITNPIDFLPTLAAICGATLPAGVKIDGADLTPLLTGQTKPADWPQRNIFFQWHRGDVPQRFRNCCVITQDYKLVNGRELYDLPNDWSEERDVADARPALVNQLRHAYEAWFDDVSTTRGPGTYDPPRIHVGTPHESPTVLTWQDWRIHGEDGWSERHAGHWDIHMARAGNYQVRLRFTPLPTPSKAHLQFGDVHEIQDVPADADACVFKSIPGQVGPARVEAWLTADNQRFSARYVDVF